MSSPNDIDDSIREEGPPTPAALPSEASGARSLRRWWIAGGLLTLAASVWFFHRIFFTPKFIDVHAHLESIMQFAKGHAGLPGNFLYYGLVYALSGFASDRIPLSLAGTAILASATTARYAIDYRILSRRPDEERAAASPLLTLGLTVALTIAFSLPTVVSFTGPMAERYWYRGQIPPNIWHNSTTILVIPFAIALFWVSFRSLSQPTRRNDVWIAALSILNIAAKPSFFLVFAPTFSLILLAHHGLRRAFWARMWPILVAGLTLAGQYYYIFTMKIGTKRVGDSHVTIAPFDVWSIYSPNIPLSILASVLYPLAYVVLYRRVLRRQPMLLYALALYVVAFAMMALLAEAGPRFKHANFFWQSFICSHILFLATTYYFLPCLRRGAMEARARWVLGALGLHVVSGVIYLGRIIADQRVL